MKQVHVELSIFKSSVKTLSCYIDLLRNQYTDILLLQSYSGVFRDHGLITHDIFFYSCKLTWLFVFCRDAPCARSFYINQNYGGCPVDAGWMVVLDPHHYCCTRDNLPNKPVFFYSPLDVAVIHRSGYGTGNCHTVQTQSVSWKQQQGEGEAKCYKESFYRHFDYLHQSKFAKRICELAPFSLESQQNQL